MASTQKKTTKKKRTPPKPEPPAYNGLARLVGGVVCLLLALCVLVSYFQVDALLLTFIAKVLKGTLGYGYFLAAPALLAVAVIQLRHQGRPVILRTTCTLLVPLLSGMLCHLLLCRTAYELGSGLLPQLWKDGQTLTCGGVVAGGLALGSEALLSKVVSVVVFVVLLVAALLGALHMTPQQAVDKMKEYRSSRWEDEEDEDDLEGFEPAAPRKAPVPEKPVKEKPAKKRVNIDIPLDVRLSPQENAARYFKQYTKAKTAEKYLTAQLQKGREELQYLESVLQELSQAESEQDFNDVRIELTDGGYIRQRGKKQPGFQRASRPREFRTSAGLRILVGRNNRQNDRLTTKDADKRDIWLHTQKIHGSHVILCTGGAEPDEQSLMEAASLAAYFSQAQDSTKVPVDYTPVRFVKKPAGAKPGMVIYTTYQTLLADPDEELVKRLAGK